MSIIKKNSTTSSHTQLIYLHTINIYWTAAGIGHNYWHGIIIWMKQSLYFQVVHTILEKTDSKWVSIQKSCHINVKLDYLYRENREG